MGKKQEKGELIAKLKYWFGKEFDVFDQKNYIIEKDDEEDFVYVFTKKQS